MGIIRNAEKAATNIVYKIDDMTAAPMDVRQWADTDDASGENTVVPPETYVKVAGHLRSFQNKKSLVAFKIMPLEDMNEFTTHILEVVNAHMMLSKSNSQVSSFTLFVFFSLPWRNCFCAQALISLTFCRSSQKTGIIQSSKNLLRELCHVSLFQMKHSYSSHNTSPLS